MLISANVKALQGAVYLTIQLHWLLSGCIALCMFAVNSSQLQAAGHVDQQAHINRLKQKHVLSPWLCRCWK